MRTPDDAIAYAKVLCTRLIQGGVGELESVLEQAGIYQFENTLQMAIIRKVYSIDMSTFEARFKEAGDARKSIIVLHPYRDYFQSAREHWWGTPSVLSRGGSLPPAAFC